MATRTQEWSHEGPRQLLERLPGLGPQRRRQWAICPIEPNDNVDRLLWMYPQVRLLMNSPSIELLRWVQRAFPVIKSPGVQDSAPLDAAAETECDENRFGANVMNAVDIEGVSQRYGSMTVLQGLNLSLGEGEVLGLFGHNGAGKTTTMKLILGLMQASEGRVRVLGRRPQRSADVRRQLGYLPENVTFYPQLSGRETLRHFARLKGTPERPGGRAAGAGRPGPRGGSSGQDLFQGHAPAPGSGPGRARRAAPAAARRAHRRPRPDRHPGPLPAGRPPAPERHQRDSLLPRAARRGGAHQPRGDPRQGPPAGGRQPGQPARRSRPAGAHPRQWPGPQPALLQRWGDAGHQARALGHDSVEVVAINGHKLDLLRDLLGRRSRSAMWKSSSRPWKTCTATT